METEKYLKDPKKTLSDTELKRASEGGWFRGLDGNHVIIYPTLYTPKSLPMMHWPSTQALFYLVPKKIFISAFFASSFVRNNIFLVLTVIYRDIYSNFNDALKAQQ